MELSILLCSLPNRLKQFSVIEELTKQAKGKPVEILYLGDNWQMSVGEKRNNLIYLATGKYICFVDDDDRVEPNYVSDILDAINQHGTDCINFQASVSINESNPMICHYSKEFTENVNLPTMYLRQPNHLMVWKKSIVELFPEINVGEDNLFGENMAKKNYSEYNIDKVLYHYDFNSNTTEAQKR